MDRFRNALSIGFDSLEGYNENLKLNSNAYTIAAMSVVVYGVSGVSMLFALAQLRILVSDTSFVSQNSFERCRKVRKIKPWPAAQLKEIESELTLG